jgi:putative DNA primase/helicase
MNAKKGSKPFHEVVAESLVEQLKKGTAPWQKPWKPGDVKQVLPINPTTGKRYRGINILHLMSRNYDDVRWMTYKQALSIGGQVKKGEKGTQIQYWKFSEEQIKRDENGKPILDEQGKQLKVFVPLERPRMFFATVFNAEQIEGLPPLEYTPPSWNTLEQAESLLHASGATIKHGEVDRAFYRPSTDTIHLPLRDQFESREGYYATALHELAHWTGHSSRLERDISHPFGSEAYAREELRAEISSMILGAELHIGHNPEQHAAYVSSWIRILEDDPLEIFRAAADAEKIRTYIVTLGQKQEQAQVIEVVASRSQETTHIVQRHGVAMAPQETAQRTYISVPYREKEEAKALGARWDRAEQSWYIPHGVDSDLFTKWRTPVVENTPQILKTQQRFYLTVPYGERDAAKAAGALWDRVARSWYAGPDADLKVLERWSPERVANQQEPAMSPSEEFSDALRSLGCIVTNEHPIMDGKHHRISTEGDKQGEKAGFYIGYLDGHPAGYVKNNRTGVEIKWKAKGYSLTDEQKAKLQAEAGEKLAERAAKQEQAYEETAQRLQEQMSRLVPVTSPTAYMQDKGIQIHPGVMTDEEGRKTYIPAYDTLGKQWSIQYIHEDGTKRFAKESRKEGCFHPVGGMEALGSAPLVVIAEGYATAASLAEALGQCAICAFDSGNLPHVAKVLHEKFPDKPILIAGDDDHHLKTNPGRNKAEEAARLVGGDTLFPVFAPGEQKSRPKEFTDFNDLATKSTLGMDGVKRQVNNMVQWILQGRKDRLQEQREARKEQSRKSVMRG